MKAPLITVENLCMDFEGERILKNISFEIAEGEILGIIGRSGAGKTVLMHLMRGVEQPPTSGKIIYHTAVCNGCAYLDVGSAAGKPCPHCGGIMTAQDVDLWNEKDETLRRRLMRRTAIMFQRTFALYGDDRVIENVLHALDDIEYPPEQAINRAADLIDQVRLSHRMMHIARDLSGGEKQRVVLARQLAKEPFMLFADEPTGTLDPGTAKIVHEMLSESAKVNNMGIVVTSHFSQVIEDVASRAILLVDGSIAFIGTPRDVIAQFMKGYDDSEKYEETEFGEKMVVARDLVKRYISVDRGVVKAVNGVSFEVQTKEIFGVIGKSGAGKTTLSGIIAGLIEPTSGEMNIKIGEEWVDMTKPGVEQRGRATAYIGLLHQEYDLFPHRTVVDNLTDAIGLEFPKELAMRKALVTLRMAGFSEEKSTEILERMPAQLSEGERHRVALAQVLIREPRLVILDEPTGTMDPITKIDVKHSIMHAREEMDETFIVVSHDMDFVRDICDRLALMRGGKIVEIGKTAEVLAHLTAEERKVMSQPAAPPAPPAPEVAMVTIHLDGERLVVAEGSTLGRITKDRPPGCAVAIIRPATQEQAKTGSLAISTTAGQITVELSGEHASFLESPALVPQLVLHWADRYAAAFGPFPSGLHPERKPHLYERGDVILGCGGYEPARSYLLFSKSRHSADHGADESGGIIGKVVSGLGVLDRWSTGDKVTKIEPVISWADTSRSFTTTDPALVLEDGMRIVTRVAVMAQGFSPEKVTTEAAGSVEHMLLALQSGRFVVDRATSTHIADLRRAGADVPREYHHPRREGAVTVRAMGKAAGGVFFYRTDVPSSMVHSIAGQVVQGIELVRLAQEHDVIAVNVQPERIDLLGLPTGRAKEIAAARGIALVIDKDAGERIVVSQDPGTTLEVLAEKKVTVTTAPIDKVIDIELDDAHAPASVAVFRQITGLVEHDAGMLPVFMKFDDVVLFRPEIPGGMKITQENPPVDEAPAAGLGITNDSRKNAGLVGVRVSANREFGPTSEPFEGTNMIGRVIDTEKLKKVKEREKVYIREVRK